MSVLDAFFTWGGMLLESKTMTNVSREIEHITSKLEIAGADRKSVV